MSSCVSTKASSASIKKKRRRSISPQNSPTYNKKRVELFGDSPTKISKSPMERRNSLEMENTIELNGGEIELNKFIEDCNNHPCRKEIEIVRVSGGVTITDHERLLGKRVRFPKLKEFHMNIEISSLKHREVNSLAGEINLMDYLFFSIKVGKKFTPAEFWPLGINVSLVINGITLLKIDQSKKFVVMNKIKDCLKILDSLEGESGVKTLCISQLMFPGRIKTVLASSLERLIMLSLDQIPDFNVFIRKFKRLKELCILSAANKKIDLSTDLLSKERLTKLALGSSSFSASAPVVFKSLEELFFWRSSWDSEFENNFSTFFPNLKKAGFFLGDKVTFKLLYKVMQIKTISEIGCGSFDWTSGNKYDTVAAILESVGLTENDKSFVLTKNVDENGDHWVGKKGTFDLSQEEIFKNFQFYHLYSDYAIFRS